MIGIRRVKAQAVLVAVGLVLGAPTVAVAATGGSSLAPSPLPSPGSAEPSTIVQPGNLTVSASGNGITVTGQESALLHDQLQFSGSVPASAAGQPVQIERLGRQTGWEWAQTVSTTVAPGGSFSASWQTNHIGRFSIRALVGAPLSAQATAASPTVTVTVYRPSLATQYGPGFYGHRTACGRRQPHAAVRDAGRDLLPRSHARGAGGRPGAVRQRGRLGPHRGDRTRTRNCGHGADRGRLAARAPGGLN